MKKNAIVVLLVAGLVVGLSSLATAGKNQYKWDNVPRIVAIGDVHASYDNFVAVLKNAELIDDELNWIGGETHLVQLGDVPDRGAQPRECMDLLMKLEEQAEAAGGRVHALIGNHEGFNLIGITDFITPKAFATYRDPKSEKEWEKAFKAYYKEHLKEARAEKRVLPPKDEVRAIFRRKYPPGYFGHQKAFSQKGEYGRWVRDHKLAVIINGIVFSHGDWSEEMSELGVEEVNKRASDEFNGRSPIEGGISFHVKGPLQYRGLSKVPLTRAQQEELQESVDKILANLGVERMVVGHTVTQGVIEPRFGGKHISIDTGMARFYEGGHQVALEIEGDKLRAIHPEGKVDLPDYLDEDNFFDYLVEVGAVDKGNVSVQAKLSEGYRNQGNLDKAAEALETLLQSPTSVPFRYHQTLGDIYRDLGKQDEAQKNYSTYIDGLQQLVEKTPENPLLKNLLARFCLDRDLKLDVAEAAIQKALSEQPDNASFLLTYGRLQVAIGQFGPGAKSLEQSMEKGPPSYEGYYHLGLAYVGLGKTEKAKKAFQLALKTDPAGAEAREELHKLSEAEDLSRQEVEDHEEGQLLFTYVHDGDRFRRGSSGTGSGRITFHASSGGSPVYGSSGRSQFRRLYG